MRTFSFAEIASDLFLATPPSHLDGAFVQGASVDSRTCQAKNIFFALPGEKEDGHRFLAQVAARGASAAVVHASYEGPSYGLPLFYAPCVLSALQSFASIQLKKNSIKVVAITGSLGKTTVKDFTASLLSTKYRLFATPGNANSQIGLPLSILNGLSDGHEMAVLEMGMTERGQISNLVKIAPPLVALIAQVALVHAENFDTIAAIAEAKAEIFSRPETEVAFYHKESDYENKLSGFGYGKKIAYSLTDVQADCFLEEKGEGIEARIFGSFAALPSLCLAGAHNRLNFLAALSIARFLGVSWDAIAAQIPHLSLPQGRLQRIEKDGIIFINDAYNASELSMLSALSSLPSPKNGGRRIAVLADMLELGSSSESCHRAVGDYALDHVDLLFCYGTACLPMLHCWQEASRPVVWGRERDEILPHLRKLLKSGDVVLLKGSFAKAVWKVIDELY